MLDGGKLSEKQLAWLRLWLKKKPGELEPILRERAEAARTQKKNRWQYVWKYVLGSMLTLIFHIRVSQRKIRRLYDKLEAACSTTPCLQIYGLKTPDLLEALRTMRPRIFRQARNIGHYWFLKDHAVDSPLILAYVSQWSPGTGAMEFHLKHALDGLGHYFEVSKEDTFAYFMVMHESTAKAFTWRDYLFMRDIVRYLLQCEYKPRLVVLAAGTMTETRDFGWTPERFGEYFSQIDAYDFDNAVPRLLKAIYQKPMDEYGIDYHIDDVCWAFRDRSLRGQTDIVYAKGFMSYHSSDDETRYLLARMKHLLKPGGILIAEWQVMEWEMIRCATSLGWGGTTLDPEKNVKSAVERISAHAKALGLQVKNYVVDPGNTKPTFVKFCLRKPKQLSK